MGVWLLKCNPDAFDLETLRRDGEELESWTVQIHLRDLAPGDPFVLWVTGRDARIVAVGHLTDEPLRIPAPDTFDPYWKTQVPGGVGRAAGGGPLARPAGAQDGAAG